MEDGAGRVELGVVALLSAELTLSSAAVLLLLLLLVVTAAPFKLLIRAEAVLLGAAMRLLGGSAASVSPVPAGALVLRLDAVLMLS